MLKNKNLFVIAIIAVVNALGYGIVIPVLYSYSIRYGLNDFHNGLLFSIFSVCQFLSTPIIGRLSDTYGRKPLLLISLAGTMLSFLLTAFAPSAIFLFIARALDGITAGNIPVVSAVISDTTKPEDRAKGFGIIGASFGFGFLFGPAISAITVGYNMSLPFLIAAAVTFVAIILTAVILPETNAHKGQASHGKLFDFVHLAKAVVDKNVGSTLLISLLFSLALSAFIYVYQPFSIKILYLSATDISINFTLFGLVNLITQSLIIPRVTKRFGEHKTLIYSALATTVTFLAFFITRRYEVFIVISILHALVSGFITPLTQALLSKEVDAASQGSIMGINSSYMSIGMIFGPIIGGVMATYFIPLPFLFAAGMTALCIYLATHILKKHTAKIQVF